MDNVNQQRNIQEIQRQIIRNKRFVISHHATLYIYCLMAIMAILILFNLYLNSNDIIDKVTNIFNMMEPHLSDVYKNGNDIIIKLKDIFIEVEDIIIKLQDIGNNFIFPYLDPVLFKGASMTPFLCIIGMICMTIAGIVFRDVDAFASNPTVIANVMRLPQHEIQRRVNRIAAVYF